MYICKRIRDDNPNKQLGLTKKILIMQTTISISGGINGNSHLKSAICTSNSEEISTRFGGYKIIFQTKKEANKALWEAYKKLRSEEPKLTHLRYFAGYSLSYDASRAEILEN